MKMYQQSYDDNGQYCGILILYRPVVPSKHGSEIGTGLFYDHYSYVGVLLAVTSMSIITSIADGRLHDSVRR